jgi:hypothetical protein
MNANNKTKGMRVKSSVKAGGFSLNHNQTNVKNNGLRVKSSIKAGVIFDGDNHNQTIVRDTE